MAKRPELEFPENGSGDPAVDVWQSDGTFDSHKAETIFEETKNWPPEQRAAMLRSLRAAETRATVRTKYRHPAEMAAAVTPGYRITPALAMISTSIERVLNSHRKINLSVSMPPQEGKLVASSTPVPTPSGWRKHGELGPGDHVFHPDGRVIEVTARHPEAETQYRVHFSDHTDIEVHGAHEWTVYDRTQSKWRTMETVAMARRKIRSGPAGRGGRYVFQLPFREAVDLPDADLLIDPYTLGAWLGDGSSSEAALTHHPDDEYEFPYPRTARCVHKETGIITDYYGGDLRAELRALGLLNNKHVPRRYLRGSISQRRALLEGLIDTDGCITGAGTDQQVVFDNANEQLVRDVAELARSLGYRAHVHAPSAPRTSTSGIVGKQWMWRVGFSPHDMAPARLSRKVAAFRPALRRRVSIVDIEKLVIPGTGNCITVGSPDGLYCVGEGWTPTHNSSLCSVWAPLRALQLNPNRRIILATYAQPLADMHSRTAREVISTHGAGITDPLTGLAVEDKIGLRLAQGANKISFWSVEGGAGGLLAAGIGATITGMPADLLIIDDPFKNMMEADSATHRANVELWFSSVALTRLAPDASIILIQCMTGDTPVLRPDGTETPLADIRPGDEIATYEDGALTTATVKNWASQGYDRVSKLVFASGRQVRANARHPFLVAHDDGTTEWIRLADLKPGHRVIATSTGANDPTTPEDGAGRIGLHCGAPSEDYGFTPRDIGVNGPASSALLTAATSPPSSSRGCAAATMASTHGRLESGTPRTVGDLAATCCCAGDTASTTTSTTACSPPKTGGALSAALRLTRRVCQRIGTAISAWITTRRPACANCFATTAMSASEGFTTTPHGSALLPTISTDTLLHIEPDGIAEVFDIEVERTENFIANGLVSHNTRWHPEDLAGKVLAGEKLLDPSERTWRHLNIPAIAEEGIPDALGREPGTPMVSARDTPEAKRNFAQTRKQVGERTWYALYQGSPRNPAGGIFQRAWFDPRLPQPPSYPVASVVGIDPADSGEGDETGIVCGALYQDGMAKVALTHDRSGMFTSDQWAREGVLLALEQGARVIAVEGYTAAKTYVRVVRQAYTAIHNEAVAKRKSGALLTPVEQRALTDIPPFQIKPWRGANKADAVARAGGLSQSLETGRCRTVEGSLAVFEEQACDWQMGQHQPDRVAAAIITHDILMEMAGAQMQVAAPVNRTPTAPPAWMRRHIGKQF